MRIVRLFMLGVMLIGFSAYAADPVKAVDGDKKIVTSKKYVDDALSLKQPKLNDGAADWRNNVVLYTNQAGVTDKKPIVTSLSGDSGSLPTVGAVNTGLNLKQNKLGENKTAGNVVTYTSTAGTLDQHDVYKGASAAYNANGLIEAQHANSAIRKGLNDHLSCAGNAPGTNGPCWLWTINDQVEGTVYTPHN